VAFVVRRTLDEPENLCQEARGRNEKHFSLAGKGRKDLQKLLELRPCVDQTSPIRASWWDAELSGEDSRVQPHQVWIVTAMTSSRMVSGTLVCGHSRPDRPHACLPLIQGGAVIMVSLSRITEPNMLLGGSNHGSIVNGTNVPFCAYVRSVSHSGPCHSSERPVDFARQLARSAAHCRRHNREYTFQTAIGLLASIYVWTSSATLFLIPELKGKRLNRQAAVAEIEKTTIADGDGH